MMLDNRTINCKATLIEALKKMDALDKKLLIVMNKNEFSGLISAGDIQRAVIQNKPLETPVSSVLRKNIRIAKPEDDIETIKQMMFDHRMELCPVVNPNNEIISIYLWEELFGAKQLHPVKQFNLPVVVMAGGYGTRLKPLTNILPKPLIPFGEKTFIEHIFEKFNRHGSNNFYISVNYKAELVEFYLENQKLLYDLEYFQEDRPMGTAGSLSLLKGRIKETFFVSNCDILVNQDYSEILDYHRESRNDITIVSAIKHYPIPYGTIETTERGQLVGLTEKPELTFKINTGMYILEPHLLEEIPKDQFFHITDLIQNIHDSDRNVGVFPISEGSWTDIGTWDEYLGVIKE
jgi:dTDP-glucose pyrophosphorylase